MSEEEATKLVNELFGSWGPRLVRYVSLLTNSRPLGEDLVQEVFMSLYRALRWGKPIQNPQAWTFQAARNQVRKSQRDERRHKDLLRLREHEVVAATCSACSENSPGTAGSSSVALEALSRREKEVVLLRLHCMKYREIAEEVGISPKTVSTLLARALRKLQAAAEGNNGREGPTVQEDSDVPRALRGR